LTVKILIVDDEPHAREGIRIRLCDFPEVNVIGECSSGREAVEAIEQLKPDIVFLDIQMPEMNGFEVLQNLAQESLPIIIFVTAFDKYALKAFEHHALDYLLKPVNEERFKETVRYALSEVNRRNLEVYAGKLKSVVNEYLKVMDKEHEAQHVDYVSSKNILSRLMIKTKDQISIISVEEIDWIESAGDYVYIHSERKKYLIRETLTALEQKMNTQKFVRIHRSSIVNIDKIKSMRQNEHGDFDVFLNDGTKLKLSRTYRANFQNAIGSQL
jgi:two-component system LytT family response regulator